MSEQSTREDRFAERLLHALSNLNTYPNGYVKKPVEAPAEARQEGPDQASS